MALSQIGRMAADFWNQIPEHYATTSLDGYVVMPNHIHGIIVLRNRCPGEHSVGVQNFEPLQNRYQHIIRKSIGSIVRAFKASVTRWCRENDQANFGWQRNFYEHVIRNERQLLALRQYIINNPLAWHLDRENPSSDNYSIDTTLDFESLYEGNNPHS